MAAARKRPVKPKNKPKPRKRAGVKPKKRAAAAPKKRVASPRCAVPFNARGDDAPPFRSCQKSAQPNSCDIPKQHLDKFYAKMRLANKGRDFKKQCSHATNCDIISGILPAKCMRGWRITSYMGHGSFGYVFGARSNTSSKKGALKIQEHPGKSILSKELRSHKQFAKLGLSPEVHFYCTVSTGGHRFSFLNMGRIDTTLGYWLQKKHSKKILDLFVERLFQILDIMRKKKVTHGDFHAGNIGFVFKREGAPGKIQLLDHGWSSTKRAMTELELVQFMRTLHRRYIGANKDNTSFLLRRCQKEAKRRYGLRISLSQQSLEERQYELHNLHKQSM